MVKLFLSKIPTNTLKRYTIGQSVIHPTYGIVHFLRVDEASGNIHIKNLNRIFTIYENNLCQLVAYCPNAPELDKFIIVEQRSWYSAMRLFNKIDNVYPTGMLSVAENKIPIIEKKHYEIITSADQQSILRLI